MRVFGLQYEKENIKRIAAYSVMVDSLYSSLIDEIVYLMNTEYIDSSKPFSFSDYPRLKSKVDDIVKKLNQNLKTVITKATNESWDLANKKNDALIDYFLKNTQIPQKQLERYAARNLEALKAFQSRKTKGFTLSDKVWKYSRMFKQDMELSLDVGIADGKSAAELSRDIRNYLKEPDKLFRRVRDLRGNLHLSKAAKKYHPTSGTYRSSYKNALRLTRTEINSAYKSSDYERRKNFDFVVGIEVRRSNRVFDCAVCESLKGRYPKDFKFTNWHPNCRCFTVSILATKEEFIAHQKRILAGEDPELQSVNEVNEMPENFKAWIKDNEDRIARAKTLPYFVRDNMKFVDNKVILDRSVNELMFNASGVSIEIGTLSNGIAKEYNGYSTPVNLKAKESISRKVTTEYGGDTSEIKDSVRTTIILPQKNMDKCLENIKNNPIFIRVKQQLPDDFLGYSGTITNVRLKNGVIGEIQINTDKMIYAKEKKETAIKIIGEKRWSEIRRSTGLSGGLGHKYYEEWRSLDPVKDWKRMAELEKLSKGYYKHFR